MLGKVRDDLAYQKTETVLITNRRKKNTEKTEDGEYTIVSKVAVKYPGVMIDTEQNFGKQLEYAFQKAASTIVTLAKI